MNELLNKLSSYNLFNYLFPGVLFVVLLDKTTNFCFVQEKFLEGAFLYYFFGLLINRVGSLFIQPLLQKTKLVVFQPSLKYNKAKHMDQKIEIFSETNNMFRSIAALFLILAIFVIMDITGIEIDWYNDWVKLVIVLTTFVFLVLSYRKQTKLIFKHVDEILSSDKK